jgi:spermidine synthase
VNWFAETLHSSRHGFAQSFEVSREIVREQSPFQELVILETPGFGRILVLDGVIQTTERDEFIYHEMLTHVPLVAHGNAKRVLIIGGGDGGVLREVMRHPVEKAVMVEIDGLVVERCREFMPSLSDGAFEDPRAELLIDDGIKYVATASDGFDVIIVDSTDPVGPGEVLFTDEFYGHCGRLLGSSGILVTQGGVPFFQGAELTSSYHRLKPHFGDVSFYVIAVPTYVGGFMALGWASSDGMLRHQAIPDLVDRYVAAGLGTRYYAPAVHAAAFALPPYVSRLML